MNKLPTKDDLLSIVIRGFYTFIEVLLGYITVGRSFLEIDWPHALSVALVAMIYSVLKSMVVGVPETKTDGTLTISTNEDGDPQWFFKATAGLDDISSSSVIRMKIDNQMKE